MIAGAPIWKFLVAQEPLCCPSCHCFGSRGHQRWFRNVECFFWKPFCFLSFIFLSMFLQEGAGHFIYKIRVFASCLISFRNPSPFYPHVAQSPSAPFQQERVEKGDSYPPATNKPGKSPAHPKCLLGETVSRWRNPSG